MNKKILLLLLGLLLILTGCRKKETIEWEELSVEEAIEEAANYERYEVEEIQGGNDSYRAILKTSLASSKTARKEILSKTKGTMKKILEGNQDIEFINIEWQVEFTDKLGNSKFEPVIRIDLSNETISKINWDSFDYNNFPDVADDYWEHQAIK